MSSIKADQLINLCNRSITGELEIKVMIRRDFFESLLALPLGSISASSLDSKPLSIVFNQSNFHHMQIKLHSSQKVLKYFIEITYFVHLDRIPFDQKSWNPIKIIFHYHNSQFNLKLTTFGNLSTHSIIQLLDFFVFKIQSQGSVQCNTRTFFIAPGSGNATLSGTQEVSRVDR